MDKEQFFQLTQQVSNITTENELKAWFRAFAKVVPHQFCLLGEWPLTLVSLPVCINFPVEKLKACLTDTQWQKDPLFISLDNRLGRSLLAVDPIAHPIFGRRLIVYGAPGPQLNNMLLMSFGNRQPSEDEINAIYFLAPHLHHAVKQLGGGSVPDTGIDLSSREREILIWLRYGKSNWEISQLMSITERTVKFHLQNIYKKLNVNNRTYAAIRANEMGLM
ncbi:helix-turn-helix transcriptional regulator [Thaumasiovibrio subtropicus]|uniref:helix-turn-helix transcriptional regulator n=1 Tax=Thaumasiovibrio subtropicus TaxID=1891207 RepID=UPI00192CF805|nr:helix-turn-helix transcriptional regulator [Thaumasiovibrio subtropicus]